MERQVESDLKNYKWDIHFNNYTIEDKFRDHVYLINNGSKKYVVKEIAYLEDLKVKYKGSLVNKLASILNLTNLDFNIELNMLSQLNKLESYYYNVPELIDSDKKSWFVTSYINSNNKLIFAKHGINGFIKALAEFQIKGSQVQFTNHHNLMSLLYKPTNSIIKNSFTRVMPLCGFLIALKTLTLSIRLEQSIKRQNNFFLLHGDLAQDGLTKDHVEFRNVFIEPDKIYFYDYYIAFKTRKYFLQNIIEASFSFQHLTLQYNWIEFYLEEISNKVIIKKLNLDRHIRLGLLRIVVGGELRKREINDFFENTLLNKTAFGVWLDLQKKSSIKT